MPYNTTAIPPRKEVTGQTQLPLSRVKRIVSVDPDISVCSNNAAFAITVATELFIQYLAEEGQKIARAERKPRRNIQYKDLAKAVSSQDSLEFLEDIIPTTAPYKTIKEQAARVRARLNGEQPTAAEGDETSAAVAAAAGGTRPGTAMSVNGRPASSRANGARPGSGGMDVSELTGTTSRSGIEHMLEDDPSAQLETEARSAAVTGNDDDVHMTG